MRTELIIFIRPPIIHNGAAAAVAEELRSKANAHSTRNAAISQQSQVAKRRFAKSAAAAHLSFRPRRAIVASWSAANRFGVE